MFGYVRPYVPSLQVQEYEIYRAVYCGLCRTMGEVTGQASRLTLSYDFCFLAALRMAFLDSREVAYEQHRCPVHFTRSRFMAETNPALVYTAAAAACLTDGKRLDDLQDETGTARLKPYALTPLCRSMQHHVQKHYPTEALAEKIRNRLAELSDLEKAGCTSAEETAQVFGLLMQDVFTEGLTDSTKRAIAGEFGLRTGRFIYICDAMDDLCDDIRNHRFNPLAGLWGDLALNEEGKPSEMLKSAFRTAAIVDLEGLGRAVELLPDGILTRILKNIVYQGMPYTLTRILAGKNGNPGKRRLYEISPGAIGEITDAEKQ
ncbi:MAG: hypothetical protein IJ325_05130 [Clostridia bacterium]|nr:hypothetical protein [Clostridia bacterium]